MSLTVSVLRRRSSPRMPSRRRSRPAAGRVTSSSSRARWVPARRPSPRASARPSGSPTDHVADVHARASPTPRRGSSSPCRRLPPRAAHEVADLPSASSPSSAGSSSSSGGCRVGGTRRAPRGPPRARRRARRRRRRFADGLGGSRSPRRAGRGRTLADNHRAPRRPRPRCHGVDAIRHVDPRHRTATRR